jgi:hypothetical protein
MTGEDLEHLAVYRTHKHCTCPDCQCARRILWDYDHKQLGPRSDLPEEDGARDPGPAGRPASFR